MDIQRVEFECIFIIIEISYSTLCHNTSQRALQGCETQIYLPEEFIAAPCQPTGEIENA